MYLYVKLFDDVFEKVLINRNLNASWLNTCALLIPFVFVDQNFIVWRHILNNLRFMQHLML